MGRKEKGKCSRGCLMSEKLVKRDKNGSKVNDFRGNEEIVVILNGKLESH